jgi:hypothetical protein
VSITLSFLTKNALVFFIHPQALDSTAVDLVRRSKLQRNGTKQLP